MAPLEKRPAFDSETESIRLRAAELARENERLRDQLRSARVRAWVSEDHRESLKSQFNELLRSDFYVGMDGELDQEDDPEGEWVRLEDVAKMLGFQLSDGKYGVAK